jgi:alpha-L-fucosidase
MTSAKTEVVMLGYSGLFSWTAPPTMKGMFIDIPAIPFNKLPSKWAWTFKISNVT